jgi:predicted O-linked N-acetylglucosamine transferase (SPINDLY family)
LVFAQKPAPIQVSYLGYPNTTGMATIDYRLTDAWADPPGAADALHTEKLIRLPAGFLCYSPPKDSPAVGTLPSLARGGAISFGSFNNLAKLTAEAIELWSRILGAVPGSRLLIKNRVSADPKIAAAIVNAFGRHDIDRDRIDVRAPLPTMTEHLQAYGEIDIALDTFPYNGTTTTCEALWMGVPVVALAGNTHAARVGVSILQQVNLSELIAISAEQYVQTAVMLASDSSRLQTMREGLRNRLAASMLLDAAQITGEIESAYLAMWNQWSIRCSIDIPS